MVLKKLALAATAFGLTIVAGRTSSGAEAYQTDSVHSSVVFRVKHMNASYAWGRFNDISGAFSLDGTDLAQSRFAFQVKAASVDTGNAKRDQHLKSPDFLNAVQFPTISFKSRSAASAGPNTFEVTGDLTLHGVTKPVTVKFEKTGSAKNPMGKPIAGISASFVVKRSEFGMGKMVGPVGDDIWVNVSIEGIQQ